MGIFINLDVAYNVSDDEWEPVYEESLYLAKKFKLMDFHELELFGDQLYCGVPVEEQAAADERFWSTIGDYETMGRAEYQRLYRKLGNYQSEQETGKCYDPLLSIAPRSLSYVFAGDRMYDRIAAERESMCERGYNPGAVQKGS